MTQTRQPRKNRKVQHDKYALYLASVQAPDFDVRFFSRVYRNLNQRSPAILREDFCGTAAICCEWVKLSNGFVAYGVDNDLEPLEWGELHNLGELDEERRGRVHLVQADVRNAPTPPADVIAALNFSYCCFKTRSELLRYFRAAREALAKGGVFVVDLFGGYEVLEDQREDVTAVEGFNYVWEQASFDPITHDYLFHIHFRFPDGTEMTKAFTYDWRLWTVPEVTELMNEAGFGDVGVYWEGTDRDTGEGNGVYRRRARGEADASWNVYIVGHNR